MKKIPTIEEIQGRTIGSVVREHGYGAMALFGGDVGERGESISRELAEHATEHGGGSGPIVDRVSYPTDEENRRLRLAVGHIAAALDIPQGDLRSIHLTPHVLTASAISPDGLRSFVDGRVLR